VPTRNGSGPASGSSWIRCADSLARSVSCRPISTFRCPQEAPSGSTDPPRALRPPTDSPPEGTHPLNKRGRTPRPAPPAGRRAFWGAALLSDFVVWSFLGDGEIVR